MKEQHQKALSILKENGEGKLHEIAICWKETTTETNLREIFNCSEKSRSWENRICLLHLNYVMCYSDI